MNLTFYHCLEICDKSFHETKEGYLKLRGIIARSGKQNYMRHELGLMDGNPHKQITLTRPREEVTSPVSIISFLNQPVTDDHPASGLIDINNFKSLSKGMITDVEATPEGQLAADLLITDPSLIQSIKDGKRQLSAGYTSNIIFSDDGETATQTEIRGNHVAFVNMARCGRECSIFDSKINEETGNMAKMKIKGVEIEINDTAAPMVTTLINDVEELTKGNKILSDKVSTTEALLDAEKEKVVELEKMKMTDADVAKVAEETATLWGSVKVVDKDFDCKGKAADAIRKEIVVAKVGDTMKEKDSAYIAARFDVLVDAAIAKNKDPLTASLRDVGPFPGKKGKDGEGEESIEELEKATKDARHKKMERNKKVGDFAHGKDKNGDENK